MANHLDTMATEASHSCILELTIPVSLVTLSSSLISGQSMQIRGNTKLGKDVTIELTRSTVEMQYHISGMQLMTSQDRCYRCEVISVDLDTRTDNHLLSSTALVCDQQGHPKSGGDHNVHTVSHHNGVTAADAATGVAGCHILDGQSVDHQSIPGSPHKRDGSGSDLFTNNEDIHHVENELGVKREVSVSSSPADLVESYPSKHDTATMDSDLPQENNTSMNQLSSGITYDRATSWRSRKEAGSLLEKLENKCRLCDFSSFSLSTIQRHVAIKHKLSAISYSQMEEGTGLHEGVYPVRNQDVNINTMTGIAYGIMESKLAKDTFAIKSHGNNKSSVKGEPLEVTAVDKIDLDASVVCKIAESKVNGTHDWDVCEIVTDEADDSQNNQLGKDSCKSNSNSGLSKEHYSCPLCQSVYNTPFKYRHHLTRIHKDSVELDTLLKDFEQSRVKAAKKVSSIEMPCGICGEICWGYRIFSHLKMWHTDCQNFALVMQETTSIYNRKRNAMKKLKEVGPQRIKCPVCGKELQKASLTFHVKFRCKNNKNRRKLWECGVCGFGTVFEDKYRDHVKSHPDNRKDYMCDLCGISYRTKGGIQMHCRTKHGQVLKKPLPVLTCNECGKQFYSKSQYKRHMNVHTGEAHYRCDECGKHLRDASTLRKHYRTIHLNQYRFTCPHCTRGFERKTALESHRCGAKAHVEYTESSHKSLPPRTDLTGSDNLVRLPDGHSLVLDINHGNDTQLDCQDLELTDKGVVYLVDPETLEALSGSQEVSHEILQAIHGSEVNKSQLMQILVASNEQVPVENDAMETYIMEVTDDS